MKITKGYVAVKEDGTFLQFGIENKWGTEVAWVSETNDIEAATVLSHPTHRTVTGRHSINYTHKFTYVPVEVRREVIQTGWGVQP